MTLNRIVSTRIQAYQLYEYRRTPFIYFHNLGISTFIIRNCKSFTRGTRVCKESIARCEIEPTNSPISAFFFPIDRYLYLPTTVAYVRAGLRLGTRSQVACAVFFLFRIGTYYTYPIPILTHSAKQYKCKPHLRKYYIMFQRYISYVQQQAYVYSYVLNDRFRKRNLWLRYLRRYLGTYK